MSGDFKGIKITAYDSTGHSISKTVTVDKFTYLESYKHSYSFDYDFSEFSNDIVKLQITLSRDAWVNYDLPGVIFSAFVSGVGSSNVQDIITAITNQTDKLLEQPNNNDFSSDKINGQVNSIQDKMGVLSFGETVLSDFVDLWTVTGSTELTLPAFTINVANVDYQVWGNQTFDLNRLDGWFGSFMSFVRRVSTCVVWIACLNYIIKQAEEFFSNG